MPMMWVTDFMSVCDMYSRLACTNPQRRINFLPYKIHNPQRIFIIDYAITVIGVRVEHRNHFEHFLPHSFHVRHMYYSYAGEVLSTVVVIVDICTSRELSSCRSISLIHYW